MTEKIIYAIFSAMNETLMDNLSIDCDTFSKMMEMMGAARDELFKFADCIGNDEARMKIINAYHKAVM